MAAISFSNYFRFCQSPNFCLELLAILGTPLVATYMVTNALWASLSTLYREYLLAFPAIIAQALRALMDKYHKRLQFLLLFPVVYLAERLCHWTSRIFTAIAEFAKLLFITSLALIPILIITALAVLFFSCFGAVRALTLCVRALCDFPAKGLRELMDKHDNILKFLLLFPVVYLLERLCHWIFKIWLFFINFIYLLIIIVSASTATILLKDALPFLLLLPFRILGAIFSTLTYPFAALLTHYKVIKSGGNEQPSCNTTLRYFFTWLYYKLVWPIKNFSPFSQYLSEEKHEHCVAPARRYNPQNIINSLQTLRKFFLKFQISNQHINSACNTLTSEIPRDRLPIDPAKLPEILKCETCHGDINDNEKTVLLRRNENATGIFHDTCWKKQTEKWAFADPMAPDGTLHYTQLYILTENGNIIPYPIPVPNLPSEFPVELLLLPETLRYWMVLLFMAYEPTSKEAIQLPKALRYSPFPPSEGARFFSLSKNTKPFLSEIFKNISPNFNENLYN